MKSILFALLTAIFSLSFASPPRNHSVSGYIKIPANKSKSLKLIGPNQYIGDIYISGGNAIPGSNKVITAWLGSGHEAAEEDVDTVTISGSPDFTIETDQCTNASIPHGLICSVSIRFTPSSLGIKTANLVITEHSISDAGHHDTGIFTFHITASSFNEPVKCPITASGSIIGVAEQSLGESISLTGLPFELSYTSTFAPEFNGTVGQLVPEFGFNSEGWTISTHHLYSKNQSRLFLGTGSISSREYSSLANGNIMVTSQGGDEVYIFTSNGKHLETRTFLTGSLKYLFSYDSNDRLIRVTDAYGKSSEINRDQNGKITSMTGPFGQTTSFIIGTNGLFSSLTNPNNESYHFTYKLGTGLLESFTKPGGQVSNFSYDSNGKLIKDLGYGGNFWELVSQAGGVLQRSNLGRQNSFLNSYDSNGNFVSSQTAPTGHTISRTEYIDNSSMIDYQYRQEENHTADDARFGYAHKRFSWSKVSIGGQNTYTNVSQEAQYPDGVTPSPFNFSYLTESTNINGSSYTTSRFDNTTKTRTITSSLGVISKIKYDNYEKPISIKNGTDVAQTFTYNSLGQLAFTAQGPKNQTSFEYNNQGLLESVTNGRSETAWYNYDLSGRKTSMIASDGRAVQIGYDANGNVTSLTPPGRPAHYFEFDAMELNSKYLPPAVSGLSSKDTLYSYNLDKQLATVTKPSGTVVTYNYNATTGLLTSTNNSTGLIGSTSFSYLPNTDLVAQRNATGVRQNYTYFGGVMQSEELVNQNTASLRIGKVSFEFDNSGRITSHTISDRNNAHVYSTYRAYNNDNQVVRYGEMSLSYNLKSGRLSATALGTVKDSYSYDQYGALSKYDATVAGRSIYSYELTRDNMSRIVGKKETVQGVLKTYNYKYDNVGRLIEVIENGVSAASFVYDANGNRTNTIFNGTSFASSYDDQDRMLNFGAQTYSYDPNGNLLQSISGLGVQTDYDRDVNGDANVVSYPDGNATTMFYDVQRRIVTKNINFRGVADRFVYDHQNRIVAAFSSGSVVGNMYHYPTGSHSPDYLAIGYDNYRIIKDHLGSPRLVVKAYDGTVVQKISYTIFGKPTEFVNPLFQPFGFAGGFYDDFTKIARFGARDYDTETGRWTQKDPIGFIGGDTNLYGYVTNDPVNFIDPTGLDKRKCSRRLNSALTPAKIGKLRHDYVEFKDSNGNTSIKSWGDKGMIDESGIDTATRSCGDWQKSSDKADSMAKDYADTLGSVMDYGGATGYNCQDYSEDVMRYQGGK